MPAIRRSLSVGNIDGIWRRRGGNNKGIPICRLAEMQECVGLVENWHLIRVFLNLRGAVAAFALSGVLGRLYRPLRA